MATRRLQPPHLLLFFILLNTGLIRISAANDGDYNSNTIDYIRTSCGVTLYPDLCYISLSRYANAVQEDPAKLAKTAVAVTLSKARRMAAYLSNLSRQADYGSHRRTTSALHDCFSNYGDVVDEIRGSLKEMRRIEASRPPSAESFRFQMSNVQTWMSSALTYEDTCTDGFEDVEDGELKKDVCERTEVVKKFTSNALALVNSYVDKTSP